MQSIYDTLEIPTIINAKGPSTRVGGGIMAAEVADAMRNATQFSVEMSTLQGRASEIISEVTGAEAGIVTAGAAAGLLLGTAASICGLNPALMNRLPDTSGMRHRVIMARSQRNLYDHAVRAAGVELVEVGLPDRYSGAGVRDAETWEYEEAIDENTACVLYVAQPTAKPALPDVVEVAHANGVPVLVDAAAQLPPTSNLRAFIDDGADLVAFSGGKAIGGPQGSGILCGRRDLIASALLQNLDMDLFMSQWRPPSSIFGNTVLRGLPQHGIGRSAKVAKEQIIGLLVALRRFARAAPEVQHNLLKSRLDAIQQRLERVENITMSEEHTTATIPVLRIKLLSPNVRALDVALALQFGEPGIHLNCSALDNNELVVDVSCVRDDQLDELADRLHVELSG